MGECTPRWQQPARSASIQRHSCSASASRRPSDTAASTGSRRSRRRTEARKRRSGGHDALSPAPTTRPRIAASCCAIASPIADRARRATRPHGGLGAERVGVRRARPCQSPAGARPAAGSRRGSSLLIAWSAHPCTSTRGPRAPRGRGGPPARRGWSPPAGGATRPLSGSGHCPPWSATQRGHAIDDSRSGACWQRAHAHVEALVRATATRAAARAAVRLPQVVDAQRLAARNRPHGDEFDAAGMRSPRAPRSRRSRARSTSPSPAAGSGRPPPARCPRR